MSLNQMSLPATAPDQPAVVLCHTYHYCAEHLGLRSTTTIDGILQCADLIASMDRYAEVKKAIAVQQLTESSGALIIRSLSYLGLHPLPLSAAPNFPQPRICLKACTQ